MFKIPGAWRTRNAAQQLDFRGRISILAAAAFRSRLCLAGKETGHAISHRSRDSWFAARIHSWNPQSNSRSRFDLPGRTASIALRGRVGYSVERIQIQFRQHFHAGIRPGGLYGFRSRRNFPLGFCRF